MTNGHFTTEARSTRRKTGCKTTKNAKVYKESLRPFPLRVSLCPSSLALTLLRVLRGSVVKKVFAYSPFSFLARSIASAALSCIPFLSYALARASSVL